MSNIDPKALGVFEKELGMIQDATLQAFFYNALAVAPQSFHDDEELLENSKKAFHILNGMLIKRNVQGAVRDALLGTVFICDIMLNELEENMKYLHTVAARKYLEERKVHKDIHQGLWENIIRAIESHEGSKSVSILLEAKPGTAEYEVASAFALAQLPYITVDINEAYRVDDVMNFKFKEEENKDEKNKTKA